MFFAATVTLTTGAQSLRALIDAATAGQIPADFNDRVGELQIQANGAGDTFHLVWKTGPNTAIDSGFVFKSVDVDASGASSRLVIRTPLSNQIDLSKIFLIGAAGGETAAILATCI